VVLRPAHHGGCVSPTGPAQSLLPSSCISGEGCVGSATVHTVERSLRLNENGSLLQGKRRSTSIGPAGAGMDRWMRLRRRSLIHRPRRRGDGPDSRADTTDETGSAPQARGWTSLVITTPVT